MDELIKKIANDYIQEYVRRNRANPTSDMVSNMVGMVKRDIDQAMSQGMTYEQLYAKAFKQQKKDGILNTPAVAAGRAYELMSTPEMRSAATGEMNGAGRGQVNPRMVNPNRYMTPGAGRGWDTPTPLPNESRTDRAGFDPAVNNEFIGRYF